MDTPAKLASPVRMMYSASELPAAIDTFIVPPEPSSRGTEEENEGEEPCPSQDAHTKPPWRSILSTAPLVRTYGLGPPKCLWSASRPESVTVLLPTEGVLDATDTTVADETPTAL